MADKNLTETKVIEKIIFNGMKDGNVNYDHLHYRIDPIVEKAKKDGYVDIRLKWSSWRGNLEITVIGELRNDEQLRTEILLTLRAEKVDEAAISRIMNLAELIGR
jgi:hypothetical protein